MDSVLGGSGHHLAGLVNTQHGLVPLDEPISNHGLLNHGLGHGMGGDLDIHSHPEVVGHHMEDMVGGYVGHPESQVPGRARARKPSQKQAAIYGGAPAGRKLDPPEPQVARSRRANAGNRLSELLKEQNKSIQALEREAKMEKQAEDMVRRQHHRTPAHPQRQRSARQPLQCEYVDAGWDYAEDSEGDWGSEEEADAEPSASEESDGEGGRRQVLDLMPGCFRCGFSKLGCKRCQTNPTVTRPFVRWKVEEGRPQYVQPAPVFYPTEAEFRDPSAYIASIRERAAPYGICNIVPPASWNPPFALGRGTDGRTPESFKFSTRKQFTSHLCMRAPRSFGHVVDSDAIYGIGQGTSGRMGGRMGRMDRQDAAPPGAHSPAPPSPNIREQEEQKKQAAAQAAQAATAAAASAAQQARRQSAPVSTPAPTVTAPPPLHQLAPAPPPPPTAAATPYPPSSLFTTPAYTQRSRASSWAVPMVAPPTDTPLPRMRAVSYDLSQVNNVVHSLRPLKRVQVPQIAATPPAPGSVRAPAAVRADGHPVLISGMSSSLLPPPPPPPTAPEDRASLYGGFVYPHPLVKAMMTEEELTQANNHARQLLGLPPPPPQHAIVTGIDDEAWNASRRTNQKDVKGRNRKAARNNRKRGKYHESEDDEDEFDSEEETPTEESDDIGSGSDSDDFVWGGDTRGSGSDSDAPGGKGKRGGKRKARSKVHDSSDDEELPAVDDHAGAEDDAGGADGGFGHGCVERKHTLRSFQAYADWARALHFRLLRKRKPGALAPGSASRKKQTPGGKNRLKSGGKGEGLHGVRSGGVNKVRGAKPGGMGPGGSQRRIPTIDEVEAEFWRLVETPVAGRVVETLYGSDLDTGRHGSGFPLPVWRDPPRDARSGLPIKMDAHARQYQGHPWNINNITRGRESLLRYMKCDELVTGVMVPWLYVGSCLSAFCWHIEDHALYSINYLHMGAPKVWYGVPSEAALAFEVAMRDALPHLFEEDPLLLHRLVTMLSPAELRARGVPCYRLVHAPGTFVVTFPGAYHAGFNMGFNVAEAVNFAPPDWLPHGTDVVRKYRRQGKAPTLAHDKLLLTLAQAAPLVAARYGRHPVPLKVEVPALKAEAGIKQEDDQNHAMPGQWMLRWADGLTLGDVPVEGIMQGAGELAVRVAELQAQWQAARLAGIMHEQRMDLMADHAGIDPNTNLYTSTADCDCIRCKCDLFTAAVISPDVPRTATCLEHWQDLGVPAHRCVLLYRYSPDEAQAMLDRMLTLFPEAQTFVDAASARVASAAKPVARVRRLGPIVMLEGLDKEFLPQGEQWYADMELEDPFNGDEEAAAAASMPPQPLPAPPEEPEYLAPPPPQPPQPPPPQPPAPPPPQPPAPPPQQVLTHAPAPPPPPQPPQPPTRQYPRGQAEADRLFAVPTGPRTPRALGRHSAPMDPAAVAAGHPGVAPNTISGVSRGGRVRKLSGKAMAAQEDEDYLAEEESDDEQTNKKRKTGAAGGRRASAGTPYSAAPAPPPPPHSAGGRGPPGAPGMHGSVPRMAVAHHPMGGGGRAPQPPPHGVYHGDEEEEEEYRSLPPQPPMPPPPMGMQMGGMSSGTAGPGVDRPQRRRKVPSHMMAEDFVTDVPTWTMPMPAAAPRPPPPSVPMPGLGSPDANGHPGAGGASHPAPPPPAPPSASQHNGAAVIAKQASKRKPSAPGAGSQAPAPPGSAMPSSVPPMPPAPSPPPMPPAGGSSMAAPSVRSMHHGFMPVGQPGGPPATSTAGWAGSTQGSGPGRPGTPGASGGPWAATSPNMPASFLVAPQAAVRGPPPPRSMTPQPGDPGLAPVPPSAADMAPTPPLPAQPATGPGPAGAGRAGSGSLMDALPPNMRTMLEPGTVAPPGLAVPDDVAPDVPALPGLGGHGGEGPEGEGELVADPVLAEMAQVLAGGEVVSHADHGEHAEAEAHTDQEMAADTDVMDFFA